MLFMSGVSQSIEKFIITGDATAVFGRTCKISIDANRAAHIRQEWKLFLKDDGVLPVIPEIVSVDKLRADPPEHTAELDIPLVFHQYSHTDVFRVWSPEVAFPGLKFVHVAVVPTH